jgi:hypothetical protein
VVLSGERQLRTAYRATSLPQAVKGLRTGHLVDEVKIDEEQIGLAFGGSYDVVVPHLLTQCLAHDD